MWYECFVMKICDLLSYLWSCHVAWWCVCSLAVFVCTWIIWAVIAVQTLLLPVHLYLCTQPHNFTPTLPPSRHAECTRNMWLQWHQVTTLKKACWLCVDQLSWMEPTVTVRGLWDSTAPSYSGDKWHLSVTWLLESVPLANQYSLFWNMKYVSCQLWCTFRGSVSPHHVQSKWIVRG